jgi:hypothetical protein
MRLPAASAVVALALSFAPTAQAIGGNYVIRGGSAAERTVVVDALDVSSFDWSVVPDLVTIHIARGTPSRATRGDIWLDADLLDAGTFAMGVVQHEYAHQVDFFLFDDAVHAELLRRLGGDSWCAGGPNLPHADYGCERFASMLAWTYWRSPENCLRPALAGDESAVMKPARFKALMRSIFSELGVRG